MRRTMALWGVVSWFTIIAIALIWRIYADILGLRYNPGIGGLGIGTDFWLLFYVCTIPPMIVSVAAFLQLGFIGEILGNSLLLVLSSYLAVGIYRVSRRALRVAKLFVALECIFVLFLIGYVAVFGPPYWRELRLPVFAGGIMSLVLHLAILRYLCSPSLATVASRTGSAVK